jgi:TPR repeat protein
MAACLTLLAMAPGARAAPPQLAPDSSEEAFSRLRLRCHLRITCPLSAKDYSLYTRAMAGEHEAEFEMGEKLERGQGMKPDRDAAVVWYGRAAEGGHIQAARALNRLYALGAPVHADNGKIAAALRSEAASGNADAGRALSEMSSSGRGVGP